MVQSLRSKFIVGNWKMNKTIAEAMAFVTSLTLTGKNDSVHVGVALPFTMINSAAAAARGSSIAVGAQNISEHTEGAFTGEVSCSMVKDAGASFVIVGHSERRQYHHENDPIVNKKAKLAIHTGLRVVVCMGETLEQHQSGKTQTVLKEHLLGSLKGLTPDELKHVVVAYEPIWAIGTGETATPEIAQEVHHFCRELIRNEWGQDTADHLLIQYGGSVKPENAAALLQQPDIDGFLVGGASLSVDSFAKIIQSYKHEV